MQKISRFRRFLNRVIFEFTSTFQTFWIASLFIIILMVIFILKPAYQDGDYITINIFWISNSIIASIILLTIILKSISGINEEDDIAHAQEKYKNKL